MPPRETTNLNAMNDLAPSEDEIGHVAVDSLSVDIPNSIRVSVDDDCSQTSSPEASTSTMDRSVDSPPSYDADALLQTPHLRRKYNIQPREDEGREMLPPYSSEISLENLFSRKVELEGAVHRASDRNWYRVYATLQGTALTFHKYKSSGYFSTWSSEGRRSDAAAPGKMGQFLKSYNLQHADVGIAADYFKKRYVIRVRAETDQFLLSCFKIETFVHWLQALAAAIDIAPPLDSRSLPRDFSIPRTRRRRPTCSTSVTDLERNATLVREQYEIMRTQYPGLIEGPIPENATPIVQRPSTSRSHTAPSPIQIRPSPNRFTTARTPAERLSRLHTQSTAALSSSTSITTSFSETPETHPSISPEGKWRPEHQWSATYDMMYARRCMAILTSRSPRKSDIVIMKGQQWIVDWVTGKLTRCEPPDYGEIFERPPGGIGSPGKQRNLGTKNGWGVRVA